MYVFKRKLSVFWYTNWWPFNTKRQVIMFLHYNINVALTIIFGLWIKMWNFKFVRLGSETKIDCNNFVFLSWKFGVDTIILHAEWKFAYIVLFN